MDSNLYNEIGKAVEKANKQAGTSLTEKNLLYVVKVATDIANQTGANFDDLLGEGIIAMKKYEEKYDPSLNSSFTKGAAMSVRGYMMNLVNRQGNLVHIPVNHLKGFKKGQERLDSTKVEYMEIDSTNYDTLGFVENDAFSGDREVILQDGLNRLDINGRIAIEMKLHMGKYAEMTQSEEDPTKMVFKYKNNMQSIADELEVPLNTANKIYKEALDKLTKYCTAASNN